MRWNVTQGGGCRAVGVGGGITGHGADVLVIDDPHATASSDADRESAGGRGAETGRANAAGRRRRLCRRADRAHPRRTRRFGCVSGGERSRDSGRPATGRGAANLDGHPFDGIIGAALLRQFLSTLDYRNGRLILRPRSASNEFEAASRAANATIVPMWLVPDHFIFARAAVN
ncbi:MAG: hypothetical protein WCD38_08080 [Candidatus Tumulicola sp.]